MKNRDVQLDIYRSLTMIYIVCIIHVLYWLGIGSEPIKSILLFEMPIIFFISGAAVKISNGINKTFTQTLINRFKRIIIPYYWYILYSFIFLCIMTLSGAKNTGIGKIRISDFINIISLKGSSLIPFESHLWFLVPYFLLSISTPIQIKLTKRTTKNYYFLINLALFTVVDSFIQLNDLSMYSFVYYLKTLLGYNLFYIVGIFYYKELNVKYLLFVLACSIISFTILVQGESLVMQIHKFPPDIIFITYGLIILALCGLIFTNITIPYNRILKFWNENGYELFLYQNYSYYFLTMILLLFKLEIKSDILWFLLCSTSIFTISIGIILFKQQIDSFFRHLKDVLKSHCLLY